jgi:hypothetical protein
MVLAVLGCNGGDGNGSDNGYVPPSTSFSLSGLIVQPLEVVPNEVVNVTVTVANTGSSQGNYNAVLNVNGVQEATKDVTVSSGANQDATFSITREDSGTYEVSIGSLSDSFTVMSAEMVLETAFRAMSDVSTLQFDMERVSIDTEINDGGTSTLTETVYGAVDIMGLQAYQIRTFDNGSQLITEETYISNGWMYFYRESPSEPGEWRRSQIGESNWLNQINTLFLLDFIELFNYELIGIETIDGVKYCKLEFGPQPIEPGVEVSILLWIAVDTRLITQVSMDFDEDYGTYTTASTATLILHHYNEPVAIELPSEAEAAEDITP